MTTQQITSCILNIGDSILRNRIEKKDWDKIFLPFIVLRRLDCLLTSAHEQYGTAEITRLRLAAMNEPFGNSWAKDDHMKAGGCLAWIAANSKDVHRDLTDFTNGFSEDVTKIFQALELLPSRSVTSGTISRLNAKSEAAGIELLQSFLVELVKKMDFTNLPPTTMGDVFEDCIRRFNEEKKTDAGEHYTPRDAIELLARLLLNGDVPMDGSTIEFYDPTCGTGGILLEGEKALKGRCEEKGIKILIHLFGQELMSFTHGICQADLLLRKAKFQNIQLGDTLVDDKHPGKRFRYQGANPPYGVKWKAIEKAIRDEAAKGENGRFPAGTPKTVQEGQLLFLQHMVSKMETVEKGGGRIAIVMNGNPLFAGDAGDGDSNIRGYLLKYDLVEAIIALPKEMFFNTGIATYIWVLNNNKAKGKRVGKVQLIDASGMGSRMSKSLGNKRYLLSPETIKEICKWHETAAGDDTDIRCKVVPNEFFGYHSVDIAEGTGKKPKKDTERIPLLDVPDSNLEKLQEIIKDMRPDDAPDFEITSVTVGWEIPFTQIFYKYQGPEDPMVLAKKVEAELAGLKIDLSFLK